MPNLLIITLANLWIYAWYARVVLKHIRTCGEIPNPAFAKTINDKFLWRKVFDRNPAFIGLSDKLICKQVARQKCPDIALPQVLWVGMDAADIPAHLLKGDVIVKATHGSGFCFPIFSGEYDRDALESQTRQWLNKRFGRTHWEWGYLALTPQLYVEELILDENGGYGTSEAKIYVYCGRIEEIVMIYDRQLAASAVVLDGGWKPSTGANSIGAETANRPLPANRKKIEEAALNLCSGFDHMRCDLYLVGDRIFFGEYTVYNEGGYLLLKDDDTLLTASAAAWDIRRSWFLTRPQPGLKAVYAKALLALLNGTEAGT